MRAKHIAVVDNDTDVLSVIEQMLQHAGYRVSGFLDARAMRAAAGLGEPFDLLVLDGTMRGETRATIAEFVRDARLPVVMMSGEPESMRLASEQRLQLLWKPFRAVGLYNAIEAALTSGVAGRRVEDPTTAADATISKSKGLIVGVEEAF